MEIDPELAFRIACHEAGHAIIAVRLRIPFSSVTVGEQESDDHKLEPTQPPRNDHDFPRYQCLSAAGAAAEEIMFGSYTVYAVRDDQETHREFGKQRPCPRGEAGWQQDVTACKEYLDSISIDKIARELQATKELGERRVFELLGEQYPPSFC